MTCVSPVLVYTYTPEGMYVPCGRCVACRKKLVNEWSVRLIHELEYWQELSCFFTLTYDDEHLPFNASLCKRDVQMFLKRLRKRMGDFRIKYFISGEYGSENERPHYHCILFGVKQDERQKIVESWNQGLIDKNLGYVSVKSIKYCLKYINKQIGKKYFGRLPPFRLMSKGLGKRYALEHKEIYTEGRVQTMNGNKIGMPRYYGKIIEIPEETKERLALESRQRQLEKIEQVIKTDPVDWKSSKSYLVQLKSMREQAKLNLLADIAHQK